MSSLKKGLYTVKMKEGEILCREGDQNHDLYYLQSGELMVCLTEMSKVIPLAYLQEGEYLGELSFFDGQARSANIICTKDALLIRIPPSEIKKQFPHWLVTIAQSVTRRIRLADHVIRKKGLKAKGSSKVRQLTIEEQTSYYRLLNKS